MRKRRRHRTARDALSIEVVALRRELSSLRTTPISVGRAPPTPRSDGSVTLRLPEAADIERLAAYARSDALLEGVWVGRPPPGTDPQAWATQTVHDWLAAWTPEGGIEGGALFVDEREPFVGVVVVVPRAEEVVELVYGVAPPDRGRGIASSAARLAADWALTDGSFARVELRIGEGNTAKRRVAEKAGFHFVERFETFVTGTGLTHVDPLYVRTAQRK